MSYTYEIKNSDLYYEMIIIEWLDNKYENSWHLHLLKNNYKPYMDPFPFTCDDNENQKNSFERTKNWVLQKHPELLL
jgi:hypothetical protein